MLRMLLCFRSYENWFIFHRRWRICIHFSERINKWEKIWSLRHLPSVEMRKTEERGRARRSAGADSRSESVETDESHFFPRAGVPFFCRPGWISYHTHERRIS